ncbi:hypothetical protein EV652_10331 [Kribbella steppae]|uniref:Uncharacterized protein n=1 Tax=Kribbella steppae TaxID=2512223 RepID=A0A4R2HPE8_9ACTN|nr:hypothetical protein EV652_10331 [Kribbella steppae]
MSEATSSRHSGEEWTEDDVSNCATWLQATPPSVS